MRRFAMTLAAVFAIITIAIAGSAYADCGMCGVKTLDAGEIINDVCPVMGGQS